ncbi:MAG: DUF5677 domain-containing protein [Candidatus Acidiferrales bacterium]
MAQKLTEFVDGNFLGWQNIADARKGSILMALADKSFVTFRAIRHLLQDSLFVDDASALVRVQYECIVNALFVSYSPYPVPDDYADYFMYRHWYDHQQVAIRDPKTAANAFSREVLARMEADFQAVENRYRVLKHSWTTQSLRDRADFVDGIVPPGFRIFGSLYETIYRPCSAWVHSDVRSIQSRMQQLADGTLQIHREVTPEERARFMHAANFLVLAITFPVAAELYGNKLIEPWNAIVREWSGLSPDDPDAKMPKDR